MTALDALLPGLRQRPDPAPKSEAPVRDADAGAAKDPGREPGRDPAKDRGTDFGRELGRLERLPGRGDRRDRAAAADDAPVEAPAEETAGRSPPATDPQAALRALFGAAQEAGAGTAQVPDPTVAQGAGQTAQTTAQAQAPSLPGQFPGSATDLAALAERAARRAALAEPPVERPALAVLAQETHFAPVGAAPSGLAPGASAAKEPDAQAAAADAQAQGAARPGSGPALLRGLGAAAGPSQETPRAGPAAPAAIPDVIPDMVQAAPVAAASVPSPAAVAATAPAAAAPSTAGSRAAQAREAERQAAGTRPETRAAMQAGSEPAAPAGARTVAAPGAAQTPGQDAGAAGQGASTDPAPREADEAAAVPGAAGGQTGLPAATLRQLAQAIAAEAPAASPAQAARPGPLPEGPLRLLTIQLQPGDLGTVTVRMRLQEGRLEIGLETGRRDTAELLRRDGGALTELLRGAGYQTDLVAIQAGGAEPSGGQAGSGQGSGQGAGQGAQTAPGRGQPGFPAEGGQAGGQAGNQSGGQGGEGRNPDQSARRGSEGARTGEGGHDAYPDARDRRGLYL